MKSIKEISIGILSAIASSVIILGAILVALTEGQVMVEPTSQPTVTEPVFIDTPAPGEPTLTRSPIQPTLRPVIVTPTPSSGHCPIPAGWTAYQVQISDTLDSLAASRSVTVEILVTGNCLPGLQSLLPGTQIALPPLPTPTSSATLIPTLTVTPTRTMTLTIFAATSTRCGRPAGWVAYIVQAGDTLFRLSQAVNLDETVIMLANCLSDPNLLRVGQTLYLPFIPRSTATRTETARPTVFVPTRTFTPRPTFTLTFTPVPSIIPTFTPTETGLPTLTDTPTATSVPTHTNTPTITTPPPTHTVTATHTAPAATVTPTNSPKPTVTGTP